MSVSNLQASPLAKGLFHRAVGMSLSTLDPAGAGPMRSLAAAEAAGAAFQGKLKAGSLEDMRALPADRILAATGVGPDGPAFAPIVDGYALPDSPRALFDAHRHSDVPIMIGFTRDEAFSPLGRVRTLADYRAALFRLYADKADAVLKAYPASSDEEARAVARLAAHDASVSVSMRAWAQAQTRAGRAPAYVYMFARVHPYAPGIRFADHDPATVGAYHTGDVPYWLGTLDSLNLFRTTRVWTDADRRLSEVMSDAIVAFATRGDPNGPGLRWPRYEPRREQIVVFGDSVLVTGWPNRDRLQVFVDAKPASPATVPAPPPGNGGRARD
jgi:para-nitrobenzyl esterase